MTVTILKRLSELDPIINKVDIEVVFPVAGTTIEETLTVLFCVLIMSYCW